MYISPAVKIVLENAKTFSERNEVFELLLENKNPYVSNTLVTNLYKSVLDKSYIDFGSIPESKGDLTKYEGYKNMMEVISIVKELSEKYDTKIPELNIVETAIENIITYRDIFEKGFKMNKSFIILQYNTLVLSCVHAVSSILISYVDFVKRPDKVEFSIINNSKFHLDKLLFKNLEDFNESVKKGDFGKVLRNTLNEGSMNFTGTLFVGTMGIVLSLMVVIPLIRELIFLFYYSRTKVSQYLEHQAEFLEMNKNNIQLSNLPANKKKEIIEKQEKLADKLREISEFFRVSHKMSENKAVIQMDKENKTWTLSELKSSSVSTDDNTGIRLL